MDGGSADAIFTLPVTSAALGGQTNAIDLGGCTLLDNGTAVFIGHFLHTSTTTTTVRYHNQATAAYSAITSTTPFTWTTNDEINGTFVYQAA